MTTPHPTLCIGCGRDHARGRGCAYDRDVSWTAYSRSESFAHVRLFPVIVGIAAASIATYFLVRPPENPIFLYVAVGIPILVAVALGGLGTRAMIDELRKRRYRVTSNDGRDRALVAFVGGQVHYAFGECLKYEAVKDIEFARPLSSAAALALGGELEELWDSDLTAWVRRDAKDESLLRDPLNPDVRLAAVIAMAVLGLAAREEITLFLGRYKAWGRGGGKLPKTTSGVEVALETLPAGGGGETDAPPLEEMLLSLAASGDESPTALDAMLDEIAAGRGAEAMLAAFENTEPDDIDVDAAREAWRRAQTDEGAVVMRLLQHALPERPRTIGGSEPEADA
jgi:hypothetical protein